MYHKAKRPRRLFLFLLVSALLAAACANPGSGPDGGPYDETPPHIVGMTPPLGTRSSDARRVTLQFDELVRIQNASEKVIVSPPQVEMPEIRVSGRRITVELLDTLRKNTTYTIDFSDAIEDSNEGNPLGNFTYYFSTGAELDTMEVAGHVLQADNLEPIKGILVGLHADMADSAFTTKPFDRVARTDGRGRFSIKGVAPGAYRIYALRDMDNDFKMSRGEMMAFMRDSVVTTSFPDVRYDTLWRDTVRYDTVYTVHYTHYLPDDVVLLAFNEKDTRRYFLKTERPVPEWFRVYFTAPSARVPQVRGLNFDADSLLLEERSAGNDTLTYWIRPRELVSDDTLNVAVRYLRTDTTSRLTWGTDTMRFTFQRPKPVKKKKRDKDDADTLPEMRFMDFRSFSGSTVEVYAPLYLQAATPVERLNTAAVHLEMQQDTLWIPAGNFSIAMRDSTIDRRTFAVKTRWEPGARYRLAIDSIGMTDIYGLFTKPFVAEFSVRKMEDYGNLIFSIPAVRDSAFVELLDGSEKVVLKAPVRNNRAELINLLPGQYYARLVIDRNGNGEYDTGNYDLRIQPEDTYYYPGSINLKKNWDIEQTWDIYALPVDRQKPEAIKKNKPERNKWETEPTTTETDEDEDESGFNDFMDPNDPNQQFFNQMNGY